MAERRDWKAIGCAALLGALVAFPAGLMMSGRGPPEEERERGGARGNIGPGSPVSRDVYSPNVVNDPYVIQQQLRVVEALELSCRQLNENCEEARLARQRIDEAAGD